MKQRLLHMRYWACTCLVSAEEARGGVVGGAGREESEKQEPHGRFWKLREEKVGVDS